MFWTFLTPGTRKIDPRDPGESIFIDLDRFWLSLMDFYGFSSSGRQDEEEEEQQQPGVPPPVPRAGGPIIRSDPPNSALTLLHH